MSISRPLYIEKFDENIKIVARNTRYMRHNPVNWNFSAGTQ